MELPLTPLLTAKKILIVEDERAMAKAMELKLQKAGIAARAVFSGEEAMSAMEAESYDLVLLDLMMPGMDGWEVLQKMKELSLSTPVIVTTNLSQEEDKAKAHQLGAVDYLVKSDSTIASIVEEAKSFL